MKRISMLLISILLLLFFQVLVRAQSGGGYDLSWSTIDGGGGDSNGGDYTVRGTIGQADAGAVGGGGFILQGGFWPGGGCLIADISAGPNNGIQFTWPDGGAYDIFRAVDAPYADNGTQVGTQVNSGWIYNETLLGNSAQNAYYVAGISASCGKRLAEFDFALVPGS